MSLRIGSLAQPVIFFKGVCKDDWPIGKVINIHKKHHDDGTSDTICYFLDMNYKTDYPKVIRCCLVREVKS